MADMIFIRFPVCEPLSVVQYPGLGHNTSILLPTTNLHLAGSPEAFHSYGAHQNEMEPFTFDLRLSIIIAIRFDLLYLFLHYQSQTFQYKKITNEHFFSYLHLYSSGKSNWIGSFPSFGFWQCGLIITALNRLQKDTYFLLLKTFSLFLWSICVQKCLCEIWYCYKIIVYMLILIEKVLVWDKMFYNSSLKM